MTNTIVRLVDFCRHRAPAVMLLASIATIGLSLFVVRAMSINTNIDQLLDENLAWRRQERALAEAFPQNTDRLIVVVDGTDADKAEEAAAKLAGILEKNTERFKRVTRPDMDPYFQKNGLLFLSEKELEDILESMIKAQPMLGSLAADPSLRGLFETVGLAAQGVARGDADSAALALAFSTMAKTIKANLDGQKVSLPWQSMLSDKPPSLRELRKFIITQPVMDFSSLSPGGKASAFIRRVAEEERMVPDNGVRVRLTGSVALNDEEFSSVAQGAELATGASLFLVILLLFFALRSVRLIIPILTTLVVGLIATTAFALAAVGSLNLISVAFAAMFIGVAVDFGIQFGVRYRQERYLYADADEALRNTARALAFPLGLAASTTIVGLISFVPTDYRGVAELGLIAGAGMVIAFFLNLTLLPALLSLMQPRAEPEAIGYTWAAGVDDFLAVNRKKVLAFLLALALVGGWSAAHVRFDFDPLDLKDPNSESVSTLFDIMKDPDATPYTIQILAPSLVAAKDRAAKLGALPQVDHVLTLESFVPKDQNPKLALIEDAKFVLDPSLSPIEIKQAPTRQEIEMTLKDTVNALRKIEEKSPEAATLAQALEAVLTAPDPSLLSRLDSALIEGVVRYLARLRSMLSVGPVGIDDISETLRRDWMTSEGQARLEAYPKDNARDPAILAAFTEAVRTLEPEASGSPIAIQESGKTIMGAFMQAGFFALVLIAVLLAVVLKRIRDALCVLAPLFLSGILTLATMRWIGLPLNFANVIALPLLLSLGVSYAVYFVTYWREGKQRPLSSAMARAVLFSAATTLVAFFSLSLSAHMGTRSMGQLLTIALVYCIASTFTFLPALLGRAEAVTVN